MLLRLALVSAVSMVATAAFADDYVPPVVGGHTYVQHLIEGVKAQHPEIASIQVEGDREGMKGTYVLASTAARATVFKPVVHPMTATGGKRLAGGAYVVREPFVSSTNHPIGTITFTFAPGTALTIAATAASTLDWVRPLTTTSAPVPARPFAIAWPIPAVDPVTSAVFPVRSIFM